jgi:hypothetical protein
MQWSCRSGFNHQKWFQQHFYIFLTSRDLILPLVMKALKLIDLSHVLRGKLKFSEKMKGL